MNDPVLGPLTRDEKLGGYATDEKTVPFLRGHRCRFVLESYADDPRPEEIRRAVQNALGASRAAIELALQRAGSRRAARIAASRDVDPMLCGAEPATQICRFVVREPQLVTGAIEAAHQASPSRRSPRPFDGDARPTPVELAAKRPPDVLPASSSPYNATNAQAPSLLARA